MENPTGITSLQLDDSTFTLSAVSSGAALFLAPKAADHTVTVTRKDSAPEILKIAWNGTAFALRTQQQNEWTIEPAMQDWTFGQTAPTLPARQNTARYSLLIPLPKTEPTAQSLLPQRVPGT